jgi:hypothetical protein
MLKTGQLIGVGINQSPAGNPFAVIMSLVAPLLFFACQ